MWSSSFIAKLENGFDVGNCGTPSIPEGSIQFFFFFKLVFDRDTF